MSNDEFRNLASVQIECEQQLALLTQLQEKAFDGIRAMIDLNLGSLTDTHAPLQCDQITAANPESLTIEQAWNEHLSSKEIISKLNAEFIRCLQADVLQANQHLARLVDCAAVTGAIDTEAARAFLTQTIDNVNADCQRFCSADGSQPNKPDHSASSKPE